jgi:sortase A
VAGALQRKGMSKDGVSARRRALAVALAAVVGLGAAGGWVLARDDGPAPAEARSQARAPAPADDPVPTAVPTTAAATTTTGAPATATTVPALPVPQPPPADARAPTPEVVLGTLSLPTIGVSAPMGEGVTLTAVDRGPGHWPGTALPGQAGNVVVAGHRVTNTRPFYDLDRLRPGDHLVFTMADGATWTYRLTRTEIVDDSALHIVNQTPARTATLFACHPKHSAAQRIVAHFELADG